MTEKGRL